MLNHSKPHKLVFQTSFQMAVALFSPSGILLIRKASPQPAQGAALQHPLGVVGTTELGLAAFGLWGFPPPAPQDAKCQQFTFTLVELQWYLWKNHTGNLVAVAVTAEARGIRSQVLMGTSPISDQKIVVKCVFPLFLLPGAVLISRMKSELLLYNKLFLTELCHRSLLCLCVVVSITLLSEKVEAENKTHTNSSLTSQFI